MITPSHIDSEMSWGYTEGTSLSLENPVPSPRGRGSLFLYNKSHDKE